MKKNKHPAINELYDIIKLEDWSTFCPEKTRLEKLDRWVRNWIDNVEYKQTITDTKYLSSEYMDIIKTHLTENLAEELAENCVVFQTEKKEVRANLIALRKKGKKDGTKFNS